MPNIEMDEAASEASDAISAAELTAFKVVAQWWREWYRKVGHKRLARVLLDHGDGGAQGN